MPVHARSGRTGSARAGHTGSACPRTRRFRDVPRSERVASTLRNMSASREPDRAPEAFRRAQASVRSASLRPEVTLSDAPAPTRLVPHALALTAEVNSEGAELATGRFVVLHDPAEPARRVVHGPSGMAVCRTHSGPGVP